MFDTIIGYESSSDPLNPNYTRSYGYSIEPTSQTGILATYKIIDEVSVSAGVANTWNADSTLAGVNNGTVYESQKTYMGTIALTAPDSFGPLKGATLNLGVISAVDSKTYGAGSKTSYYAGLTVPTPSNKVKVGMAFDYLNYYDQNNNTVLNANHNDDSIWVAGLYLTVQPTDKLSLNFRGELVDASGIGGAGNPNPLNGYYAGHYAEEVTATVQYQLWANVLSRVEFRWDRVDSNAFGYVQPNSGAMKDNDFMLALNLIYQF